MIHDALVRALDSHRGKSRALAQPSQSPLGCGPADRIDEPDDLIVAESAAMREVCQWVAKIAPTEAACLIRGEAGVGKWQVARAIHRQSRRAAGPLIYANCEALREADLERRLFGSGQPQWDARGQACGGLLQDARGGTLFLSQVDCLPLWAQGRLFDTLERRGAHGAESSSPGRSDARLIASTAADLETAVADGHFYRGLYHLLNVVAIHVPPLRRRGPDLKTLVQRCLERILAAQGRAAQQHDYHFTPQAWQCLLNHDWAGNLPELAGVVARSVAMSGSHEIDVEAIALPAPKVSGHACDTITVPLAGNLHEMQRQIIDEVLRRCKGNKAAAARTLGLHRRTLYRILEAAAGDVASDLD
jgi:DNA-binding NtrC family response regulator